jgi:Mrp family chromosome partitioning ATPase
MNASLAVSTKVREIGSVAPHRREWAQPETARELESTQSTSMMSEANTALVASPATDFAEEQIRGLVERVFFPGWPKASRQVVISGADEQVDATGMCARLVRQMAAELPGTVCAVEADMRSPGLAKVLVAAITHPLEWESNGCVCLEKNLWLAKPESLYSAEHDGFNSVWLRTRMSELRRNFDYTLIHAPAASLSQTIVLGQLVDGLILAIEAGKTHRAVAQTALAILKAAKVAVIGTVLLDRTFPIPEKLYKRL